MTGAYLKKAPSETSRAGLELTVQEGHDSEIFGFSATAPNIGGADWLLHLGPTNASYLAPVGKGLTVQGGIFSSFIGYDGLYAKDNLNYTRQWTGDYTPYFMLGANASYPVTSRLTATAFVLNGYWHLAHANDVPSVGGQFAYKATDRVTVKETVLYGPHQTDTALRFWRFFSDSIVERKTDRVTAAFEYQIGTESVAPAGDPLALWMAAQAPLKWSIGGPWSVIVRPEFAWDRDGRWIGPRSPSRRSRRQWSIGGRWAGTGDRQSWNTASTIREVQGAAFSPSRMYGRACQGSRRRSTCSASASSSHSTERFVSRSRHGCALRRHHHRVLPPRRGVRRRVRAPGVGR
jgi:hypothetical protein